MSTLELILALGFLFSSLFWVGTVVQREKWKRKYNEIHTDSVVGKIIQGTYSPQQIIGLFEEAADKEWAKYAGALSLYYREKFLSARSWGAVRSIGALLKIIADAPVADVWKLSSLTRDIFLQNDKVIYTHFDAMVRQIVSFPGSDKAKEIELRDLEEEAKIFKGLLFTIPTIAAE